MPGPEATLEEVDGRPALRFERLLRHAPERVWRALTEPAEQFAWHPTPARFEPRVGGRVEFEPGGRVADMPAGEVTAYEPPRLLGYTWLREGARPDHLLWELRPHDGGCLLILVHAIANPPRAASFGAGWHMCLDSLAAALDGDEPPPAPDPDTPRWRELNAGYAKRFGVAPGVTAPSSD